METESGESRNPESEHQPEVVPKKLSIFRRLLNKLGWLTRPLKRAWQETTLFFALAWPGAAIGSVVIAVAFMAYMGFHLRSGLGTVLDVMISALIGALGVARLEQDKRESLLQKGGSCEHRPDGTLQGWRSDCPCRRFQQADSFSG